MGRKSIDRTSYEQSAWLTFRGVTPVEGDPQYPELFALANTCLHAILSALLEQSDNYFATTTREVADEVEHFLGWHEDSELVDTFTYQHLSALAERTRQALLDTAALSGPITQSLSTSSASLRNWPPTRRFLIVLPLNRIQTRNNLPCQIKATTTAQAAGLRKGLMIV